MAFFTCPYCGGSEETQLGANFHTCNKRGIEAKFNALCAEVESWKNKYDLAMVCYKDEETAHTATLERLVKTQDQNAELLAALKPFADYFEGDLGDVGGGTMVAPPFLLQRFKDAQTAIARATGEDAEKGK